MPCIEMFVHQIGLLSKAYFLHIGFCNLFEFPAIKFLRRVKI